MLRSLPASICALIVLPFLSWAAEAIDVPSPEDQLSNLLKIQPLSASAGELERLLARVRPPSVVQALNVVRNNPSPELRPAVMACARRPEPAVIQSALRVLPMVRPEPADIEFARKLIESPDELIRSSSMQCAADLKDWKAIPALAHRLGDQVAAAGAHQALVVIAKRDVGKTELAWSEWYADHEEKMNQILDDCADKLRSADDADVIASLQRLMLLDGDPRAKAEMIGPFLNSSNPDIAASAGLAMKRCDPDAEIAPVVARAPAKPVARQASLPRDDGKSSAALMQSTSIMALGAAAFGLALMGALILMVFLLRTKDVIVEATRRLTRRIGKGTVRVGKGAKHWTEKVVKAIKKKITFIK